MLELKKIKKSYKTGDFVQHALKGTNLKFRKNEFVAILGPSGSGKTTMLNIIGGLDRYDEGDLIINGKSTKNFKDRDWDSYRNNCIGFIFQSYNLIHHIDILANVEMGMTLSGVKAKKRRKKAIEVLKKVGLKEHVHKKPNQLSGGQMQRVAIARALANDPDIILADEPTGALDSKTSEQIMKLIKEIAEDKLVIMVTHNPELAKKYATRIIEMKDGEILDDSNPVKEKYEEKNYNIKKTSMNFFTALHLSLNNIKTKKGRTILTAFASSIGIIGITLILSLSNGFDKQIDTFEINTLSALPIIISKQSQTLDEETMEKMQEEMVQQEDDYPSIDYVISAKSDKDKYIHTNKITNEYLKYLENLPSDDVIGISYTYATNLNLLQKKDDKIFKINTDNLNIGVMSHTLKEDTPSVIEKRYDLLAGKEPTKKEELVIEVDSKNRISKDLLDALGLNSSKEKITFEEILKSEIKVVLNDEYYEKQGSLYIPKRDLTNMYKNEKNITIKVVGIIRLKEEYPNMVTSPGIYYTNDLMEYILENNKNSEVVKSQEKETINVLSGEKLDLETKEGQEGKETILSYLGGNKIPYVISIHPKDFQSKESITNYLDKYNEEKKEEEKIAYIDQASLMSSLSSSIMDAITIVLIAFSSISLIVSSIMIGIIMYISVLERTKEIGILRSLGARKKDISRVFNAETFIIGISSGLIGIFISWLLLFPINKILYNMTNLENIAILNPIHALALVTISVILTLIGGFIPAKVASKKDPVIALRTE